MRQKSDSVERVRAVSRDSKIVIANDAAKQRGEATVVKSRNNADGNSVTLQWSRNGIGFGELVFFEGDDGALRVETECMGGAFCLDVLRAALKHDPAVSPEARSVPVAREVTTNGESVDGHSEPTTR